uniref:DUF4440 domain-containing protein n=1 Tax=Plectus sambesii TaxID=2011161 RepID=A0A914VFX7_9BILA
MSDLEQEIKNRQTELEKQVNAGNAKGAAELYDPDCTLIMPGRKEVKGRAGAEEVYQQFMDAGAKNGKNNTEEVNGSGDWAFERGTYEIELGSGPMSGGYLLVWKKINGTWLIHNDCSTVNSSSA